MYWIYAIINKTNGKKYVGYTTDILNRIKSHSQLKSGCPRLIASIKSHGIDKFVVECLEYGEDDHLGLTVREGFWINKLNPEYNLTSGGDGVKGFRHTPESKAKFTRYGRKFSEESRKKISENSWSKRDPEAQRQHAIKAIRARWDNKRG